LARHEPDIHADAASSLSLDEVLDLLAAQGERDLPERRQAIARYLSAKAGWREAKSDLHGAFAEEGARLKERKAD
jgi:hypothetical protein